MLCEPKHNSSRRQDLGATLVLEWVFFLISGCALPILLLLLLVIVVLTSNPLNGLTFAAPGKRRSSA